MERFVVVNGRILDFAKYENDFSLMRKIILLDMKDYFKKLGFKQAPAQNKSRIKQKIKFYNPELDFEITMTTNKKNKACFV